MRCLSQQQLSSFRRWLFLDQNRKCGLCEESTDFNRFVVDHDHLSGHVRKGLCSACNLTLGFAKENPELLSEKVVAYLNADYRLNAIYPGYERQAFEERRRRWQDEEHEDCPHVFLFD